MTISPHLRAGGRVAAAWVVLATLPLVLAELLPGLRSFHHLYHSSLSIWLSILVLALSGIGWWTLGVHWFSQGSRFSLRAAAMGAVLPTLLSWWWLPWQVSLCFTILWLLAFHLYFRHSGISLTWVLMWLIVTAAYPAAFYAVYYCWTQQEISLFASAVFLSGLLLLLVLSQVIRWLPLRWSTRHLPFLLDHRVSLQLRLQLSFLRLMLVAFFLIGGFTFFFFRDSGDVDALWSWLEQLLGIYVCLLLVASMIAIAVANDITAPLVQLSDRLSQTGSLQYTPLHWPRQDEVGTLVANYNRMIAELDASVRQLAEQERESAWRDMAQQVAHEIKNPLTPMRLHLQQLLRLQKEDPEQAREWSKKTIQTLIEQIDVLARIATEFSQFATLSQTRHTTFCLADLLREVTVLYTQNVKAAHLQVDALPTCMVWADRDQLARVLINLLRNAIQSIPDDREGIIKISSTVEAEQVTVSITDNGAGVPVAIRERIFQARFTTKSTGSGWGLAMAKNIMEQAGGTIGYTDVHPYGTRFYLQLPIVAEKKQVQHASVLLS